MNNFSLELKIIDGYLTVIAYEHTDTGFKHEIAVGDISLKDLKEALENTK